MHELHNALLAAYLDGEAASVAILHDFLLEQGVDPGRLHGNVQRRLRVVLGLVPSKLSHVVGCDYAEHVADLYEEAFANDGRLRSVIEIKRRWVEGAADHQQLKAARKEVLDAIRDIHSHSVQSRRPAFFVRPFSPHGWQGRRAAEQAAQAAFGASTQSRYAARDCCAAAVRAAERAPRMLGRSAASEIQWQIEHLRQKLTQAPPPPG